MKIPHILAGAAGLALFASAGLAATSDITSGRRADFYAPGRHQFYAWCAAGRDRIVYQDGLSAADAKARLQIAEKSAGQPGCALVWQGRINS